MSEFKDSLFAEDGTPAPDQERDYVAELEAAGREVTPQALAKKAFHADAHIAKLEAEQEALRQELAKRVGLQEVMDKLSSLPPRTEETPPRDQDQGKTAMSPEEVERLLQLKIEQNDKRKQAEANIAIARAKLRQAFGPGYSEKVKVQAEALGLSDDDVANLAASKPYVLFRLLGIDVEGKSGDFTPPPRSQVTSHGTTGPTRKYSYYKELRRKDEAAYWTPKIQNEIFAQVQKLGPDVFYDV